VEEAPFTAFGFGKNSMDSMNLKDERDSVNQELA
jgi:hypothetical protein